MQRILVDESHFWLFPIAIGARQRLFDGIDTTHLKLLDATTFTTGIAVMVYTPNGPLHAPTATSYRWGYRGACAVSVVSSKADRG
jgi:hypothetical protein